MTVKHTKINSYENIGMKNIYKITNNITGEVYIGQTARPIRKRFLEHSKEARKEVCKNKKISQSILKYGINNHTLELIEVVPDDQADDREQFHILMNDSVRNGLNMSYHSSKTYFLDSIKELMYLQYMNGYSVPEIAKEFGCCQDTVRDYISKNFNIDMNNCIEHHRHMNNYIYDMIDKNTGRVVKSFMSISDCITYILENNISQSKEKHTIAGMINSCIKTKNRHKNVYGYIWHRRTDPNKFISKYVIRDNQFCPYYIRDENIPLQIIYNPSDQLKKYTSTTL